MAKWDWDYATALRAIWQRSAYDRGFISNPFWGDASATRGLERTRRLADRLGAPDQRYGILHIAGSKGKGSTCAFVSTILTIAGYRTGRYISPHLHSFRERIAIDGRPIDERAFAALTERAVQASEELERTEPALGQVTSFELLTAMALTHFADAGCELAVVEVGMGGTFDSTNIVRPLAAGITALDFEHTAVLGNTIEEIARNKAGIIKPGRPVAVSPQPAGALSVIEEIAAARGSRLLRAGRDWTWTGDWRQFDARGPWGTLRALRSGLAGAHQVDNACTALCLIQLTSQAGFPVREEAIRTGLARTSWPGRFECVTGAAGETIVLDGAHTPASAKVLEETIAREFPGRRAVIILGVMTDKDPLALATALAPVAAAFVVTRAHSPRALPPAAIAEAISSIDVPVVTTENVPAALTAALKLAKAGDSPNRQPVISSCWDGEKPLLSYDQRKRGEIAPFGRNDTTGLMVATGSLSIVAEMREALGLAVPEPMPEDAG